MSKLLGPEGPSISGETFYITDGKPTNMGFFYGPLLDLYDCHFNIGVLLPLRLVQMLIKGYMVLAVICEFLSAVIGKSFSMPLFGLTYMESYKV